MNLNIIVALAFCVACAENDFENKGFRGRFPGNGGNTSPEFKFATYYGSHMVLQQGPKRSAVWGHAAESDRGATVNIVLRADDGTHRSTYNTKVVTGPVEGTAVWSVQLQSRPAGGPYSVTVSLKTDSLALTDVLFGDVWLCSGQSNMAFSVPMLKIDAQALEYNISTMPMYNKLRLFTAALSNSTIPLYDLEGAMLKWSRPSPATLGKGQGSFKFFSAVCWIYGRHLLETLGYPIGLVATDWGGTPDEAWMSPDALKKCNLQNGVFTLRDPKLSSLSKEEYRRCCEGPQSYSVLWNAMIHPLLNMTIFGAIWYQGEGDSGKSNYFCTFPSMINDWRKKFHVGSKNQNDPVFPFGFVQLAGWRPPAPGNTTKGFPSIRWQQTAKYGRVPNPSMPNTFMAVAMDLPDFESPWGNIHPRDKLTVGYRLAASGLAQAYNKSIPHLGPMPTDVHAGNDSMKILFDGGKTIINTRNSQGFEVCCPSSGAVCDYNVYGEPWQEAPIVWHDTQTVTISTKACTSKVVALRYAWRETPCLYKQCAVYSVTSQLPAPPMFIQQRQKLPGRDFSVYLEMS